MTEKEEKIKDTVALYGMLDKRVYDLLKEYHNDGNSDLAERTKNAIVQVHSDLKTIEGYIDEFVQREDVW